MEGKIEVEMDTFKENLKQVKFKEIQKGWERLHRRKDLCMAAAESVNC